MGSLLAAARARAAERARRVVRLPNPEDAGQVFVCRLPTDGMELDRLRAAAKRQGKGHGDEFHFARSLLAACCEAIEELGEPIPTSDDDPTPIRFTDAEFRQEMGASTGADAVFAFVQNDGVITSLANKLIEESGYGTEDFADPTTG